MRGGAQSVSHHMARRAKRKYRKISRRGRIQYTKPRIVHARHSNAEHAATIAFFVIVALIGYGIGGIG